MKIAFISCVSKKKKGKFPAKELYISPLFKKSLEYNLEFIKKIFKLQIKLNNTFYNYLRLKGQRERISKILNYYNKFKDIM